MTNQEAGARALLLKALSMSSATVPRMRAIAMRFSERFEAHRDEGLSNASAYVMASAESEAYLREMDRERVFA
jgi:hypothetical protein